MQEPPTPDAAQSVDLLWPQLLAAAHTGGATAPAAGALQRDATLGWQLAGAWDDAARDVFALFKPLLDGPCGHAAGGAPDPLRSPMHEATRDPMRHGRRPWVLAQLGQSLDGCIATRSGESAFVSGPECLQHLHRLRALSDAVIVGAGTVAADNPRLTTRLVPGPHPVRVLLDPALGLADHVQRAHVFTDTSVPTLWLCDSRWAVRARSLVGENRVLAVPGLRRDDGVPALAAACAALADRGFMRLFVEGGGVTVSRFLSQRLLDRLHLGVAPVLIGDGRRGLHFAGAPRLADCARPRCRVYAMGVDRLWDLDLREGAAG
jgi:diaminohydroxyphosphoribosylaminopyrimidine deaminase/5-amino-6-(5-phosphoribosylamino)uracil reductase